MTNYRLASLRPDENGIVDIYRQTTYAGGMIPRDRNGGLAIEEVSRRMMFDRQANYESTLIRMTGGFDD